MLEEHVRCITTLCHLKQQQAVKHASVAVENCRDDAAEGTHS